MGAEKKISGRGEDQLRGVFYKPRHIVLKKIIKESRNCFKRSNLRSTKDDRRDRADNGEKQGESVIIRTRRT